MTARTSKASEDEAVQMVAWFVGLIHGWEKNDFAKAAEARAALEKMGVRVRLPQRHKARKECNHG